MAMLKWREYTAQILHEKMALGKALGRLLHRVLEMGWATWYEQIQGARASMVRMQAALSKWMHGFISKAWTLTWLSDTLIWSSGTLTLTYIQGMEHVENFI